MLPRPGCGTLGGCPPDAPPEPPEACPGCGAVLVRQEETTATIRRADAAYDAQHANPADPGGCGRLRAALDAIQAPVGVGSRPPAWRTTIASVAADLDVIDLGVLVDAWVRSVAEDWTALRATRG